MFSCELIDAVRFETDERTPAPKKPMSHTHKHRQKAVTHTHACFHKHNEQTRGGDRSQGGAC